MAKFLSTNEINTELEKIIDKAEEQILLISPYLQLSQKLKALLERKAKQKVPIILIYRTDEKKNTDIDWAKNNKVQIYFLDNLHGKAYCNENKILLTSMNLYYFSQTNNYEFGNLISYKDEEFDKAYDHFEKLLDLAKKVSPKKGYCILTGKEIDFNVEKPFSYEGFKQWDKDPKSKQNYCHYSGEKSFGKTSFEKPILKKY